ncbi:MAG: hypothetical protein HYV63_22510 [Candidatus Schekmanbacteria bacterium]|nr:hypothetical protein [Candidatus Schekmanbacteria bacterium]
MPVIRGLLALALLLCPARSWAVGAVTAEVDQTLGLAALRQQTGLSGAGVTLQRWRKTTGVCRRKVGQTGRGSRVGMAGNK